MHRNFFGIPVKYLYQLERLDWGNLLVALALVGLCFAISQVLPPIQIGIWALLGWLLGIMGVGSIALVIFLYRAGKTLGPSQD